MTTKKYSDFDKSTNKIENIKVENEPIKEEVLLRPKDNVSSIEILEENIIKFNSGTINDILEMIKSKYSNIDYFFRKKDSQLHIVKYNEKLKLNINEFVNSLLKFYSKNEKLKSMTHNIKVKGNQNFCIIENVKFEQKIIDDLIKLLNKK
jgi:hypothetical protein